MIKYITAKDGLLWSDGEIIPVQEADRIARLHGYGCAEQLVKFLSGSTKKEGHMEPKSTRPTDKPAETEKNEPVIFKAWQPPDSKPTTFLRLSTRNEDVWLTAVDERGERVFGGDILKIDRYGQLVRFPDCGAPGIQVDNTGRILTS